jgi:hypothetical protein
MAEVRIAMRNKMDREERRGRAGRKDFMWMEDVARVLQQRGGRRHGVELRT